MPGALEQLISWGNQDGPRDFSKQLIKYIDYKSLRGSDYMHKYNWDVYWDSRDTYDPSYTVYNDVNECIRGQCYAENFDTSLQRRVYKGEQTNNYVNYELFHDTLYVCDGHYHKIVVKFPNYDRIPKDLLAIIKHYVHFATVKLLILDYLDKNNMELSTGEYYGGLLTQLPELVLWFVDKYLPTRYRHIIELDKIDNEIHTLVKHKRKNE